MECLSASLPCRDQMPPLPPPPPTHTPLIPAQVTGCQLLEELDLRGNALMSFPSPVTRLTRLRLLDLTSAGAIAFLPEGLGELTALTELALGDVGLQVREGGCALCWCLCVWGASVCGEEGGTGAPTPCVGGCVGWGGGGAQPLWWFTLHGQLLTSSPTLPLHVS